MINGLLMKFPFLVLVCCLALSNSGCTLVSIADAVLSTAVDVTVGAVKATGKAVGKVVDVVTPDGKD
jgi:hypothetical protein